MKTGRLIAVSFKQLGKNKPRSFLMMIGVVIGIIALTLVVSAGLGAQKRIMERVKKFGLDSLMVFSGGGREMGRPAGDQPIANLKLCDAEAIKQEIKGIMELAPFNRKSQTEIIYQDQSTTAIVFGITPSWAPVWDWDAQEGDFITEEDMDRLARVAVIGETVRQDLFKDFSPISEFIRVGNIQFEIKGIMEIKGISPRGGRYGQSYLYSSYNIPAAVRKYGFHSRKNCDAGNRTRKSGDPPDRAHRRKGYSRFLRIQKEK